MITSILIFLGLLFSPFTITPAPKNLPPTDDIGIIWHESRRLNWDDFQCAADEKEELHAMTSTNIDVKARCFGNLIQFDVKCVFVTKDSWSKNKISKRLLAHEQMHFDLTEVYARILREKLSKTQNLCGNSAELGKLVQKCFTDWKKEQDRYDTETNHGLILEKQAIWEDIIAQRLAALQTFAYQPSQAK